MAISALASGEPIMLLTAAASNSTSTLHVQDPPSEFDGETEATTTAAASMEVRQEIESRQLELDDEKREEGEGREDVSSPGVRRNNYSNDEEAEEATTVSHSDSEVAAGK